MKAMKCKRCNGTGDEPNQKVTGSFLRDRRVSANKSLREVAIKMKKSAPYISDLELGRRNWSAQLIADFEKAIK